MVTRLSIQSFTPLLASAVALTLFACHPCDESGCAALEDHASEAGTAVAGAIVYQDDVVENGCLECPFGGAQIDVWQVDGPVDSDDEAQAIVSERDSDAMLEAHERYALELDPGHYLFCAHRYLCTAISVTEGETLTVHVVQSVAWGYRVGRPGEKLESAPLLRVERALE
jgi:hypothetical protein